MFYAATGPGSIFDGVSLLSTATVILAVIIAFYCSNFLKEETQPSEQQGMIDEETSHVHKLFGDATSTRRGNDKDEGEEDDDNNCDGEQYKDDDVDDDGSDDSQQERLSHDFSDAEKKELNSSDENSDLEMERDSGLVGKLKSARLKELEAQLTRDQLEEERRIEREQLAAIFELLKKQEEELNMKEIDETELNAQLNLYR